MKTIVVLFHPNPEESVRNKILIDAIKKVKNVTVHVVSGQFKMSRLKKSC
ncbi:Flavoprotein-like_superfamily [Hexamita inflata]|uniref:Flavoprotein-like superfamily n=1 Tax=Hexamita inflata TaxID=28002 RepID=A0AA86UVT9_9EUKA|nr:Flavoprotein-like superfamily [Hexamita inflata]